MVLRFDKVVSDIVNGIKSGVDLFKEIISGKGIKGVINDFIAALEALPEKASIFCSYTYCSESLSASSGHHKKNKKCRKK